MGLSLKANRGLSKTSQLIRVRPLHLDYFSVPLLLVKGNFTENLDLIVSSPCKFKKKKKTFKFYCLCFDSFLSFRTHCIENVLEVSEQLQDVGCVSRDGVSTS